MKRKHAFLVLAVIALLIGVWGLAAGVVLDNKPMWVRILVGFGSAGLLVVAILADYLKGGDDEDK